MRAVVLTGHDGPDDLKVEQRPDPEAGPGEVRVAVEAAGINFADVMATLGLYPDAPGTPCIIGYEFAGEVEAIGPGVTGISEGDRVFGPTMFGGYAEKVTVPAGDIYPIPEGFSAEEAAALPVNYCTALAALVVMGGLREGQRVLIHAAAGGVGIAATQIAREAGAEIFGTASAPKHEAIRAQGVDHAVDYRNRDFAEEVRRLTGGEGVDLIIDATGPTNFRKDYRLLRPGGKLVMYGASELAEGKGVFDRRTLSALVRMPLAAIPWWKSFAVMNENKGVFGLNLLDWWKDEGLDRLGALMEASLERGTFRPVVDRAFSFEEAGDAHRFISSRQNVGKVLLTP
ncbi:MAG: zinc-binding dehydrogenase [Solirubrobacterales bacterium]|nr:zinc-binding dehydrogenase [Solirubrobacterales bacterium]MCB0861197.1 zinc-binding dehydrogenase [Solirubrobacterales bacterium]